MKNGAVILGLALAALFFAVLMPPEAYPDSKVAIILCATFSFFAALADRRIPASYVRGGVMLFAALLLHGILVSVDLYRSIEFTSVLWAYYCLFGFFYYAPQSPLKAFAVCMVVLCAIVSGYGIYQYLWGLEQLYSYIFYGPTDEVVKVPALGRVASGRVFSTLALPGTLWGFLVIALPFHAFLWNEKRWARAALSVSAILLFVTGFLTRSFGFLLGLFVLSAAWLVLRHRRIMWNRLTAILIVLALAGGAFYSARRGVIEGSNPASLRLKSWISAWTIFAANPLGTGLNTYGVVYPRYMLPDATETQYTHNTPLQLLSELGYPILIAAGVLFLAALRRRQRGMQENLSPYVLSAVAVWVVHNIVDINVYFPSLGVIGAILLGIFLRSGAHELRTVGRPTAVTASILGAAFIIFSGLAMIASELQYRAQIEFDENKLETAAETLRQAKSIMPLNSSAFHDFGDVNLNLYHKRREPRYLEQATEAFRRAISLSPEKSGSHTGLSLCLASAGRVEDALEEIRVAQRLYPDSTYVASITRLLEKRNAGETIP